MAEPDWLASRFESERGYLRSVAYRMLGSVSDADDAVQEAWIRLNRTDSSGVENLRAWLTTVVARVCLNMLRARKSKPETSIDVSMPDPIVSPYSEIDPEHEAILGDSVGLALLVVLNTLTPAERVAFVLHDVFGLPFDEIAPVVGRSTAAARQLASRARRRVRGAPAPDPDLARQRKVVEAFLAASRGGDFEALITLLDPDVVLRVDGGVKRPGLTTVVHGADAVAGRALAFRNFAGSSRLALVNGAVGGVTWAPNGSPLAVMGCTVRNGRIMAMDVLADPERLGEMDLSDFRDRPA